MVITDFEAVTTKPIFSHWFYDVTIDANNNKVLAGGEAMSPGPDNWEYLAMARYDSNGALYDPTFNSGQPLLQDWHSSFIHSLRVDSKGRILACGSSGLTASKAAGFPGSAHLIFRAIFPGDHMNKDSPLLQAGC